MTHTVKGEQYDRQREASASRSGAVIGVSLQLRRDGVGKLPAVRGWMPASQGRDKSSGVGQKMLAVYPGWNARECSGESGTCRCCRPARNCALHRCKPSDGELTRSEPLGGTVPSRVIPLNRENLQNSRAQ